VIDREALSGIPFGYLISLQEGVEGDACRQIGYVIGATAMLSALPFCSRVSKIAERIGACKMNRRTSARRGARDRGV
jgi:hypothetical protein